MRNKYPATCYYCGNHVAKQAFHFERNGHTWRVIHAECVFKQRKDKQNTKEQS